MLSGRLIRVARDVLEDYSHFGVIERLNAASVLSAQRTNPAHYIQNAVQLRAWAQTVIKGSKIEKYPKYLIDFLNHGAYKSALPASIASVILNGFPDDPNLAMSSGEVNLYIQLANRLSGEFNMLLAVGEKLHIEQIEIPEDRLGLDIVTPRESFDNDAARFIEIQGIFVDLMSCVNEMTTGSKEAPTLTYISTSDPVTGVAVVCAAAWAILNGYKLLLEVVEKSLSLHNTIKELRASPLGGEPDLEERVKEIVDNHLKQAIDGIAAHASPNIQPERVNEIKIAMVKDARIVVQAIANGARIGITVESLDRVNYIARDVPNVTQEDINDTIEKQAVLEHRVQQARELLGLPAPLLLPVDRTAGFQE